MLRSPMSADRSAVVVAPSVEIFHRMGEWSRITTTYHKVTSCCRSLEHFWKHKNSPFLRMSINGWMAGWAVAWCSQLIVLTWTLVLCSLVCPGWGRTRTCKLASAPLPNSLNNNNITACHHSLQPIYPPAMLIAAYTVRGPTRL